MPVYEYRCENDHTFEVMQRMSDDPVSTCTVCGAPVQRVFHPVAVHFKGSGFYATDYGRAKRSGRFPGDERQANERVRPAGGRCDPVPHRGEDLLLAGGPCPVVLVRGAAVLADAREAKRLASGEVVVARPERDALAAEAV